MLDKYRCDYVPCWMVSLKVCFICPFEELTATFDLSLIMDSTGHGPRIHVVYNTATAAAHLDYELPLKHLHPSCTFAGESI